MEHFEKNSVSELDVELMASQTIGLDLMSLFIQEVQALPNVWQKLSEDQQNQVIERARESIETAVSRAVELIASNGFVRVTGQLQDVAIKKDIQAKVAIFKSNSSEAMFELYNSFGTVCTLVLASPEQFLGGMQAVKGEKNQPDMRGMDEAVSGIE
jgi:hypothetical protein